MCFRARLGTITTSAPENPNTEAVSIAEFRRNGMDVTREKRWNRRLDRYAQARKYGMQPATTRTRDIEIAERISEVTQQPFSARSEIA